MKKIIKVEIQRYIELINAETQLIALENGGVDNWEWYGESLFNDEVDYDKVCEENAIKAEELAEVEEE